MSPDVQFTLLVDAEDIIEASAKAEQVLNQFPTMDYATALNPVWVGDDQYAVHCMVRWP